MTSPLAPCGRCRRHIRLRDARCPFCGAGPTETSAVGTALVVTTALATLAGCGQPAANEATRADVADAAVDAVVDASTRPVAPSAEASASSAPLPEPAADPVPSAKVAPSASASASGAATPKPKPQPPRRPPDDSRPVFRYGTDW